MNKLGQFYTNDIFSDLLISGFRQEAPKKILELGVGSGALIKSAFKRWEGNPKYIAAEIDIRNYKTVSSELPFIEIHKVDGLSPTLPKKINVKAGSIDVAICNPPYLKIQNSKDYAQLFEQSGLNQCKKLTHLTTDIIFLAQNIRLLKMYGELGIIIPDSLITGRNFVELRKAILTSHSIKGIIELPENIFSKTQALTHIMIIEKGTACFSKVPIYKANRAGECIDQIDISSSSLVNRMDYKFHKWNLKGKNKSNSKTLSELGAKIGRGSFTHLDLKRMKKKYIHTTNLKHLKKISTTDVVLKNMNNPSFASRGDILISRVGRAVGKASMLKSGSILISDCIYKIRVSVRLRKKVWESLTSEKGQEWFKANSKGVCAKVISKADLMNFTINH